MKNILVIVIVFASLITYANQKGEESSKITVQSLSENTDLSGLKGKYKKISYKRKKAKNSQLPTPQIIDIYLHQAKLETETQSFDQLDKDILFRRARKLKLNELSKRYPGLKKEKLKVLSKEVKLWGN